MGGTGAAPPEYTLDISEHLFRLTTEGLRLRSNETQSYQTLANLLDARCVCATHISTRPISTLKEHLVTIPSAGNIRIELSLSQRSTDCLDEVKEFLSREFGEDMTVADALSVLLFEYVIEQTDARVLGALDIEDILPHQSEVIYGSTRH